MTILHHAINGKTDERALAALGGAPPTNGGESLSPVTEVTDGGAAEAQAQAQAQAPPAPEQTHTFFLDQRLPVIQSVLEFAKAKLWMPEVCMYMCKCAFPRTPRVLFRTWQQALNSSIAFVALSAGFSFGLGFPKWLLV